MHSYSDALGVKVYDDTCVVCGRRVYTTGTGWRHYNYPASHRADPGTVPEE